MGGERQGLDGEKIRKRSGAFPLSLAYRLINMYSVRGDTVLDPFMGTGTTLFAAAASCRNSIGIEIDSSFGRYVEDRAGSAVNGCNMLISDRLTRHLDFVASCEGRGESLRYRNVHYGFRVKTGQERELLFNFLRDVEMPSPEELRFIYFGKPSLQPPCII
jgi:hypothetical protein